MWGAFTRPGRVGRPRSSRDTYRFPPDDRTHPGRGFPPGRDTRPATVLRSAQAFLRDVAGHAIGILDRHPAALDLFFVEEPALAGREPRKRDGQRQQGEELTVFLLQVGGGGSWIGHGMTSSVERPGTGVRTGRSGYAPGQAGWGIG